ncbi:MAG: hypothetical protein ACFFDW_04355 [Candidatus Thorarchaeota archaeon]
MAISNIQESSKASGAKRFLSLDITRGMAIIGMLILHIIGDTLDIDTLLGDINNIPIINMYALIVLPFMGGLAGFFLLVSATGNMVSMYRELNKGHSIRGIVLKQIIGGIVLLIFAMLSEGLIGYHGSLGEIFNHLNDVNQEYLWSFLWRWNTFETVHTIAWCLIINGLIQGLLSLKQNWKSTTKMIISYAVLAAVVVGLTQPIWDLVAYIVPGYPFGFYPNGHSLAQPVIGYENFWHILRAPFLTALAAPVEPIFPYLAVSFIGSIIGIIISQPKEKISPKFPRRMFLIGVGMFVCGLVGVVFILINIMSANYGPGVDPFIVTVEFYRLISFHRHWAPDAANAIDPNVTVNIPPFSWLAQFVVLNGFSIMIFMFIFRLIEFRGKSEPFAKNSKIIRRFGTVAFSNYNNQALYFFIFFLVSLMIFQIPYKKLMWWGTFLVLFLTLAIFSLLLWGWEKIKYLGSLEWFIRTLTNNIVPVRRSTFEKDVKWWQKGQIDVDRAFYNVQWIDLHDVGEQSNENSSSASNTNTKDSLYAFILSLVGLCSILFLYISVLGLIISIQARKHEGKNKYNTTALILSIIGTVILVGGVITSLILPVGVLGLF